MNFFKIRSGAEIWTILESEGYGGGGYGDKSFFFEKETPPPNFKWTYLRAPEELSDQTVHGIIRNHPENAFKAPLGV